MLRECLRFRHQHHLLCDVVVEAIAILQGDYERGGVWAANDLLNGLPFIEEILRLPVELATPRIDSAEFRFAFVVAAPVLRPFDSAAQPVSFITMPPPHAERLSIILPNSPTESIGAS